MPISEISAVPGGARQTATRLTLRRPDDWHVHLRDGAMLASIINYTARPFARAIVMPNLNPPITTIAAAAPHAVKDKESNCGCAGIFNAPFALESYAKTFDEEGALDQLEAFAAENGPRFYGLPLNEGKVVLERVSRSAPETLSLASSKLVPFHAGQILSWRVAELTK